MKRSRRKDDDEDGRRKRVVEEMDDLSTGEARIVFFILVFSDRAVPSVSLGKHPYSIGNPPLIQNAIWA